MPVYDYHCPVCNRYFERIRNMEDRNGVLCDLCGGQAVRVYVPVGIVFKGSGFYTTDSRSENPLDKAKSALSETKARTESGSGGELSNLED